MIKPRNYLTVVLYCCLAVANSACAYRFTNNFVRTPANARTIAVESIFDTSRDVLPHEVLWDSLQRAFAKNGHLRLASRDTADLLLRVHLSQGNIKPAGGTTEVLPIKDYFVSESEYFQDSEKTIRTLTRASSFTTVEGVSARMDVEVYDLRNKNIVLRKTYNTAAAFKSVRDQNLFANNSSFLFYEQSVTSAFKRMSDDVSSRVVTDLLVQ